jgi:hypothetical protein
MTQIVKPHLAAALGAHGAPPLLDEVREAVAGLAR